MNPLYKTSMCMFKFHCHKGDKCEYAHSREELRKIISGRDLTPRDFLYRTKMCDDGDICMREGCGFAHSEEELRKVPCRYQSFCKFWDTTCNHSHFFVDGEAAVFAPPVTANDSLAMATTKAMNLIQQDLSRLSDEIENIVRFDEKIALDQELGALEDDIRDTIKDIDRMIDELNEPCAPAWTSLFDRSSSTPIVYQLSLPLVRMNDVQRKIGSKYRTKMCKYGMRCNKKKECGYAHYESQLRI